MRIMYVHYLAQVYVSSGDPDAGLHTSLAASGFGTLWTNIFRAISYSSWVDVGLGSVFLALSTSSLLPFKKMEVF